ncbi:MAG: hypothetical protein DRO99_01335 [Candidatus Aenigmatarchaeota archaeon]|nr:MAG: hypothetical protein DRO99_01335 [Candidatus Aenigmarchaeota archaeon]
MIGTRRLGKRVDVKVGFSCNNNCLFCVQADKKTWGDKKTDQIKREIGMAMNNGASGIVFTGGEPSIRPDIIELVSYAKSMGFSTIQLQTNGRRFYYMDFCRDMVEAGMNEFGPAVHGPNPEVHDTLTCSEGSFRQTVQGIRNVRSLGVTVVTNTVVTKPNYRHLPEIARLLVSLGVSQFQFAFVHPIGNALKNFDDMVPRVSDAAPYIHKGLQIGIDNGLMVMAEAMPYCMMVGYEDYISERYIPDTEIRDAGYVIKDYGKQRLKDKAKFPKCKECIYDRICEGPWKEYPERMGSSEFVPVKP